MTDQAIQLRIGGADVPLECHHLACRVEEGRHASGRATVQIQATGFAAPDLSGVAWPGPVLVEWRDLASDADANWRALGVLAPEPQVVSDLAALTVAWTLAGVAASEVDGVVTIGGAAYWARVEVDWLEVPVQRMSNGDGLQLVAYRRRKVTLGGEGAAAPVASGLVAVTSPLYSGYLLVPGVRAATDPATGLVTWTLAGEEP